MITTIIFDLLGVIINRFSEMGKFLESSLNKSDKEIHSYFKEKIFQDFLRGKITEDKYWEEVIKKAEWKIEVSTLKKIRRESFDEIKGTKAIIRELKKRGLKLGLLSSFTKEWAEFVREKFDYEKYFDETLYSYQTGNVKPEKIFYETIFKKLNVRPENCLYIDDKKKYLKPAEELGMKVFLFNSPKDLIKKLQKINLLEKSN